MTIAVPLRVQGLDLDDDDTLAVIAESFSDVEWSIMDDITIGTVFLTSSDPVCEALGVARRLTHKFAGVRVPRVHTELVSIPDIAHRVGVSRETVRTWVEKLRGVEDFPEPLDSVGGGARGATRVWAWSDIADWLRASRKLEVDAFDRLTPQQLATLNAALARVEGPADLAWTRVDLVFAAAGLRVDAQPVTPRSAHRAPVGAVFAAR